MFHPTHRRVRANQLLCHLAAIPAFFYYGTWGWWVFGLICFYLFHGIGSGCGAHRHFSHNSFESHALGRWFMAICFTLASSGSVIGYVLVHRSHHRAPDTENDPHDPACTGPLKTWLGILDKNRLRFEPKKYLALRKDTVLRWTHDYYFLIIFSYVGLLALLHPLAPVFGYALPVVMQFHVNSALIVLAHSPSLGYRNFTTKDRSRNLPFVFKFLLLGEELHNNHHASPGSPTMNIQGTWREFDPLFPVIKFFLHKKKVAVDVAA